MTHSGTLRCVLPDFDRSLLVHTEDDGRLTAELDPHWEVGGGILNGGYLLGVAAAAAVLVSPHPHAIGLSASYLRAAGAGPARLDVTPGPVGRSLAHATVLLSDATGPLVSVQATTGTLGDGEASYADGGVAAPAATPVADCADLAERADGVHLPGILSRLDTRLDPLTSGWADGQPSGEAVIRAWVRRTDGADLDPLSLICLTDCLPPSIWGAGLAGWAPTVQLQTLVHAAPASGWCLVESRTGQVVGGWVDEDYRVWDATGRLVAQSRQLARVPRRP